MDHREQLNQIVGQRIRARRQELRMAQKGLAHLVGFKQHRISRIERGKSPLFVADLLVFAKALNTDLPELLQSVEICT